ncbi:hypothetical protein A3781_09515 [Bacillus badius]|nr:hypothetical protein A3781_09515 [Bacillus badius]
MKEYHHVLYRCGHSDRRLVWFRNKTELDSKLKQWSERHLCEACFQEMINSRNRREVEDLMNKNMPTYRRVNGAIKRRR